MTKTDTAVPFNIEATVRKGSVIGFDRGEALGDTNRRGITNETVGASGEPRPATGWSSFTGGVILPSHKKGIPCPGIQGGLRVRQRRQRIANMETRFSLVGGGRTGDTTPRGRTDGTAGAIQGGR
jgi:hypothetical protein